MRRLGAIILALALLSVPATSAAADSGAALATALSCPDGPLVINVWYFEKNLPDTGVLGNAWAVDADLANFQVVSTGGTTFCSTLTVPVGTFVTVAGPSPENTVSGGIVAGIRGSYHFVVKRTWTDRPLKANPSLPRFGWLGTMDGGWDGQQSTAGAAVFFRPDQVYFEPGPFATIDGYHFVYHSRGHGTWIVDSLTGDHGDITN